MTYEGLPSGKIEFDRLPASFFCDLLPIIDNLGELKVTLYFLWRLDRMEGDFRFLTLLDFMNDALFISGLPGSQEDAENVLLESLAKCIKRGILLEARTQLNGEDRNLYFFNSPKGRKAVKAIELGNWKPGSEPNHIPVELTPGQPNIFSLYEDNIGPITPLLAERLGDAEDEFPAKWIEEAFRIAIENNVRNWRYIEAILRRWHERGYDVREDRRDSEKTRQQYADWED
jgi:DnaD/phage-associated family protein